MTTENNNLAVRGDSLPTVKLSEAILDIDDMYDIMGKTLAALSTVTVDGESDVASDMQAHNHKDLLPDTEIEMLHTNAVPMSTVDVKAFLEAEKRRNTIAYRKKQFSIPIMTLADTTGPRIRVAYRLIRYMAHVRGLCSMGKPLIHALGSDNAQVNLFELPVEYDPASGWYNGMAAVRNLLAQANESNYEYSYLIGGDYYIAKGMSILPPPIHDGYFPQNDETPLWEYRRNGYTPPHYRADTDAPLAIYLNMMELLVRHLGIGEDDIGEQAAVQALLNPKIARLAWPCRDDIETFEESVLLPYIGRVYLKRAQDSTIDCLKQGDKDERGLGLTHAEAFDLVETYKTYAQQINVFDPERERSIVLSRLEDLAEDCDKSGMVTTKLNTIKTILQTLGLTKHDEDTNIDKRAALSNALEAIVVEKAKEIKAIPEDVGPEKGKD
ncbi:hypothetical protein KAR91_12235 [Candidatus Pacearchaeota archaeon]|nr:hypothetical protein [Candidatus Pacearchaeota archaeon]